MPNHMELERDQALASLCEHRALVDVGSAAAVVCRREDELKRAMGVLLKRAAAALEVGASVQQIAITAGLPASAIEALR